MAISLGIYPIFRHTQICRGDVFWLVHCFSLAKHLRMIIGNLNDFQKPLGRSQLDPAKIATDQNVGPQSDEAQPILTKFPESLIFEWDLVI